MAKGPEAKLVRDPTIKWAKARGIVSIRCYFGPGMRVGWPDDIFLIPGGRPLFIEFKAPGKYATKIQKKKIKLLKEAGYDVCVCDSKSKAIKAITRALDTAALSGAGERLPSEQAVRRSLFGPRVRQDEHNTRRLLSSERGRPDPQTYARRGSSPRRAARVAARG